MPMNNTTEKANRSRDLEKASLTDIVGLEKLYIEETRLDQYRMRRQGVDKSEALETEGIACIVVGKACISLHRQTRIKNSLKLSCTWSVMQRRLHASSCLSHVQSGSYSAEHPTAESTVSVLR